MKPKYQILCGNCNRWIVCKENLCWLCFLKKLQGAREILNENQINSNVIRAN